MWMQAIHGSCLGYSQLLLYSLDDFGSGDGSDNELSQLVSDCGSCTLEEGNAVEEGIAATERASLSLLGA